MSMMNTTTLLVTLNLVGMFPGYLCYGWFADKLGRKRSLILYTLCAAGLIPLYAAARTPWIILILGALVGFFGTGFFGTRSIFPRMGTLAVSLQRSAFGPRLRPFR